MKEELFCYEVEVFGEETGHIMVIISLCYIADLWERKTDKTVSSEILSIEMEIFRKKGHSKIWTVTFFSVPQTRRQVSARG